MPEILNAINNHKQSLAAPQEFYGKLTQQGQDWTLTMHFKQEELSNQSREVKLLKFPSSLSSPGCFPSTVSSKVECKSQEAFTT